MNNKINQVFKNIQELDPPHKLESKILHGIRLEKDKQIRRRLLLSYFGFFFSAAAFLYTASAFGNSIVKSEFWDMVYLAFSDVAVIAKYGNNFALSLLETFPTMGVIGILASVFTLMLSFSFYLDSNRSRSHKYI